MRGGSAPDLESESDDGPALPDAGQHATGADVRAAALFVGQAATLCPLRQPDWAAEPSLSPAFAEKASKTTFVTLEKWHCLDCAPKNHGAEEKMEAEGKRLKALNPKLEVVMYFAADLARTWYDVGVWFDEHPELELSCGGKPVKEQGFHAFDYAQPAAVDRWVKTYTDAVSTGYIDGAFVDGLATDAGWRSRWLKGCNASHQDAFVKGVATAQQQLGQKLGPDRLVFANMGPMR